MSELDSVYPCRYHGEEYLKFMSVSEQKLYRSLRSTVDCSGVYNLNVTDILIPGNTKTFILQNSNVYEFEELKQLFSNFLELEGEKMFLSVKNLILLRS